MENLSRVFQKEKEKENTWKRLSFITQFKIEFLLLFTGCRKVLGKMPVNALIQPSQKWESFNFLVETFLHFLSWTFMIQRTVSLTLRHSVPNPEYIWGYHLLVWPPPPFPHPTVGVEGTKIFDLDNPRLLEKALLRT